MDPPACACPLCFGVSFSSFSAGVTVLLVVLVCGCANPSPPSGGPRDTTPPSIVDTRPGQDSVNVATETEGIRVAFSEYVERSTVPGAVSVTPRPEGQLQFDWDGRAVEIELPTSLRDSTTYIVSFSTDLSDARGVELEEPITFAFSTGPQIDRAQIRGRVVEPRRGEPVQQVDVFAYATTDTATAAPHPLPERPAYRTQTGEDGRFTLDYLRPQRYFVVAVRDNNRNRRPDPVEPFAVPPHPALPADSAADEVPVPWLLTRVDTVGPSFQVAQPLSRQRVRVSFDEPVRLGTRRPQAWRLQDSTSGKRVSVRHVYMARDRAETIVLHTDPMPQTRLELPLSPSLVTDTLGQGVIPDTVRFQAVPRTDTTQSRLRGFLPRGLPRDTTNARLLMPDVRPGLRFNQALDSTLLQRIVSVRTPTGTPRAYTLQSDNGRHYWVRMQRPLPPDSIVVVGVDQGPIAGPDTVVRRRFRRVSPRRLGALEGRVRPADTTLSSPQVPGERDDPRSVRDTPSGADSDSAVVLLQPEESSLPVGRRRLPVVPDSTFVVDQLPEGTFRFRAFLDRNGNQSWDGGRIQPYVPAEPLTWSQELVDSRPRWTTVLPAPLRVPVLQLRPASAPPGDTTTSEPMGPKG